MRESIYGRPVSRFWLPWLPLLSFGVVQFSEIGNQNARAAVVMDERIVVSYDLSQEDGGGPEDAAEGSSLAAFSGTRSLRIFSELHPFGGSGTMTEIHLGGGDPRFSNTGEEASAEERNLNHYPVLNLRLRYRVAVPESGARTLRAELRFWDGDHVFEDGSTGVANQTIASGETLLIMDGAWRETVIDMQTLASEERASLDHNAPHNPDVATVLLITTPLQPIELFLDRIEMVRLPVIRDLTPVNHIFYDAKEGLSFRAETGIEGGIPLDGIRLVLNEAEVTADLRIEGEPNNRRVSFLNLEPNQIYTGQVAVTDIEGNSREVEMAFDTYEPSNVLTFEAEDFNFNGGAFIDDPQLNNTLGGTSQSYFDKVGIQGVDKNEINEEVPGPNELPLVYRFGSGFQQEELTGTIVTYDFIRERFASAPPNPNPIHDYHVGWVASGEWLNYSRTFPAGVYRPFARLSRDGDGPFSARLDRVTGDRSQPNQTVQKLGVFQSGLPGWRWVPLTDDDGNPANVALNGEETLRVTCLEGSYLANVYMLAPLDGGPLEPAEMSIVNHAGGTITVSWTGNGTLEKALVVDGPWTPVVEAISPYTEAMESAAFYRLVQL